MDLLRPGEAEEEKGSAFLKSIRKSFLRGLAIVIPVFITIWVLWFIFQVIDGIASPLYRYIGLSIPGIGFITAIILILLLGVFSRNLVVKVFFRIIERIFLNLPLAKSVYSGASELIHAFSPDQQGRTFRKVCMIEYPRKGIYSIGFITNELDFRETDSESRRLANIYIPLPPNPTTGILTMVPVEEVTPLSISVEQGMKLILSAGIVTPPELSKTK
ncbi:MAG: DUF502 domain-containing protein [Balneolales bacterium]